MMDNKFALRPKIKLNRLPENPDEENLSEGLEGGRFPKWLHRRIPTGSALSETNAVLRKHRLNTVCEEAKCPNRLECYSKKTATFLVLGHECTRACGFCDIDFNKNPAPPDPEEPSRIALSVQDLGLKHVVITMVARDDLEDGGAAHLVQIIEEIRSKAPACTVEILTSDFNGNFEAIERVLSTEVDIFNYNIETVERLTPRVRHRATYERTLSILRFAKESGKPRFIKSGMMVGLGEEQEEVFHALEDLKKAGCDIVTIGQYLQASPKKLKVSSFVTPETFEIYRDYGHRAGLAHVYSGPFVRSSYNAKEVLETTRKIHGK